MQPTPNNGRFVEVIEQCNDVAKRIKLHLAFVSDLPAAECNYHVVCYNRLMEVPSYFVLLIGSGDKNAPREVIQYMSQDRSRLWNDVQPHSLYSDLGGRHHDGN